MKLIKTLIPTFKQSVNARYFEPASIDEQCNAFKNDTIAVNTETYSSIINLPEGVSNQSSVTVTDHSGNSSTNNIQITSSFEIENGIYDSINSIWTYTISSDYETINLIKTSDKWKIDGIASGSGLPTDQGFIYVNQFGDPESINNNTIGSDKGLLGFNSDGSPAVMDIGGGLKFTTSGSDTTVSADVGNGLEINSTTGKIDVKTGDGITIESGAIKINLPEATGDVGGTYPNLIVNGINGQVVDVNSGTLSDGQALVWNNSLSRWVNADIASGGGGGGGMGFAYYLNYHNNTDGTTPTGTWKEMSTNAYVGTVQTVTASGVTTATTLAKFESLVGNPSISIIPGGNWNLSVYLSTNAPASEAYFLFKVYKINGTTATQIAESSQESITTTATTLYTASVAVPATPMLVTERIGIEILVGSTTSPYNVTGYFEGANISYVQTTISTPGGTGILKTVAGVIQSPSSLISDADVDPSANISGSKLQKASGSNFGSIQLNTASGDLSAAVTPGYAKVSKIQGVAVSSTTPSNYEAFIYSSSNNEWSHALITNDSISSTAAISGSKIVPNFGAQAISTSGNISGGAFIGGTVSGTTINGSLKPGLATGVIHSTGVGNNLSSSLVVDADVDSSANISGSKLQKAGASNFGSIQLNTTNGDLSAATTPGYAKVAKIQGVSVSSTSPSSGEYLKYNGSSWEPSQIDAVTTLIYDPSIAADTDNIYKTWTSLIAKIPRFTSGNLGEVKGSILIILRDDVTLTASLNLSGKVKIKGEFKKIISLPATVSRFPIIYTSNFVLQNPSEFENVNIINNNPDITPSSTTPAYCFSFPLPDPIVIGHRQFHKLILRNVQLYSLPVSSSPTSFNRRFIQITAYHRINIEMYGKSVIGGDNPETWTWG